MRVIKDIGELRALEGEEIGASGWVPMTQAMIDRFAEVTGDDQWIHIDADRAGRESRYGGTVAHGFLTLSLLPQLVRQIYRVEGVATSINYGLNKVRFPAPVRPGDRVRAVLRFTKVERADGGGVRITSAVTIEIKGGERPACAAETVTLLVP